MGYALNYYEAISLTVLDWFKKTNTPLSFSETPLCMNFVFCFLTSFVEQCYTLLVILGFVYSNSHIFKLPYII